MARWLLIGGIWMYLMCDALVTTPTEMLDALERLEVNDG